MAKRFSDTGIWEEDWFLEMPNEYKLFWFYMLATCDHAGVFKVNLRSFRGLLEVSLTSTEALRHFNNGKDRIRVLTDSTWFVEDFVVYQYGATLNLNNRLHESIANVLAKQKIELTSLRGLLDLKDRVKDKDKELKKGGVGENKNGTYEKRGVSFSPDKTKVIFPDGSMQILGESQTMELQRGLLSPHSIYKGTIQ